MTSNNWKSQKIGVSSLLALICLYYLWVANSNGVPPILPPECTAVIPAQQLTDDIVDFTPHYGYYNLLAYSLIRGDVALPIPPQRELLELSNPYDPQENRPFRLHDTSLYKGKYYLYFGPAPAVVAFVPAQLLGITISEPLVASIFMCGAFICAAYILLASTRQINSTVFLGIIALTCGNIAAFVLRRPIVYEVAIASGCFFTLLGFAFVFRYYQKQTVLCLYLTSLAWGLAAGSRQVHLLLGAWLVMYWLWLWLRKKESMVCTGAALGLPFLLCLILLGLYNYIRFDSLFEFGMKYQLAGVQISLDAAGALFNYANFIPCLYLSLFPSPNFIPYFPYLTASIPGYPWSLPPHYFGNGATVGLLWTSPIIVMLFGIHRISIIRAGIQPLLALGSYGLTLMLTEVYTFPGVVARYQLDYILPILIVSICIWVHLATISRAWKWVGYVLICLGLCTSVLLGITGADDILARKNPRWFTAIYMRTEAITQLLGRLYATPPHAIRIVGDTLNSDKGLFIYTYVDKPGKLSLATKQEFANFDVYVNNKRVYPTTSTQEFEFITVPGVSCIEYRKKVNSER